VLWRRWRAFAGRQARRRVHLLPPSVLLLLPPLQYVFISIYTYCTYDIYYAIYIATLHGRPKFKVIMLGDYGCGKTCLLSRYHLLPSHMRAPWPDPRVRACACAVVVSVQLHREHVPRRARLAPHANGGGALLACRPLALSRRPHLSHLIMVRLAGICRCDRGPGVRAAHPLGTRARLVTPRMRVHVRLCVCHGPSSSASVVWVFSLTTLYVREQDTGGQEKFRCLTTSYYRDAMAAVCRLLQSRSSTLPI
jgi:hypothetical protein